MRRPAFWYWRCRWFPPALDGPWTLPSDPSGMDLFLLMGQSNMAGYGCVRADDPWQPGDWDAVPGVLCLGGQSSIRSPRPRGRVCWRPASHPLHLNQKSSGFGLGLEFARRLHASGAGRAVGLIPCAWGGAPIDRLGPGTPLFENGVRRARHARRSGRLRGVLWHQGESDTASQPLADSHAGKLAALMRALRRVLDEPGLAFLIGDLAEFVEARRGEQDPATAARTARVRRGLREVAADDPRAEFVESRGLGGVDAVHFGRDALLEFGRRYAEAWERMGG